MITLEFEAPNVKGLAEEVANMAWPQVRDFIEARTIAFLNAMKVMVGGIGHGRLYKRTKSGKMHRASLPGAPPARDRGDYVNSWDYDFKANDQQMSAEGRIGSRLWSRRGVFLELGTTDMQPRPHVAPVAEHWRNETERMIGS